MREYLQQEDSIPNEVKGLWHKDSFHSSMKREGGIWSERLGVAMGEVLEELPEIISLWLKIE